MTVLAGGVVVTPDGVCDPGWIEIDGDRIAGLGPGHPGKPTDLDLAGRIVWPGYVDTHVHGGGGASYLSGDPDEAAQAARFHLQHGTTTTFASLITEDLDVLQAQVRGLADLVDDGVLAGIHLEGPWLAEARCGAHDRRLLRAPDRAEVQRLLDAGRGTIAMVTLAPELPGGLEAVRQVIDAGAVAAVGHSDASYDVVRRAIEAGATVGTHVFNAMPPIHHREPGPIVALLEDERVTVELIADGVHLHPSVLGLAAARAGVARTALVTDAMTATGMPDGVYRLGGQDVVVRSGVARLADGDSIAGSTLTMHRAGTVAGTVLGPAEVAAALSTVPARTHGLDDVGALCPGMRADLVLTDPVRATDGAGDAVAADAPAAVMRAGTWVHAPSW